MKRMLVFKNSTTEYRPYYKDIPSNFYPVTNAIAMRDKNIEIIVMPDRVMAGSADLTEASTIELIQNRRILYDDDLGIDESLNETDYNDRLGIKVTALYRIQISKVDQKSS